MELNPNHQVTQTVRDQWHKIAALILIKLGQDHVVITEADISSFPIGSAVVCHDKRDGLHIYMVDEATANRLARDEGGLPS